MRIRSFRTTKIPISARHPSRTSSSSGGRIISIIICTAASSSSLLNRLRSSHHYSFFFLSFRFIRSSASPVSFFFVFLGGEEIDQEVVFCWMFVGGARRGCIQMTKAGGRVEAEQGALRKGPWTPAEDAILKEYVSKNGERNWNSVQRSTGLARCGKSCRLRWTNHLHPDLKKCAFSSDEEIMILRLHRLYGNKWARIAANMPGRTDNEIKNYWNTRVKRLQRAGVPLYPPGIQNGMGIVEPSPSPSPVNSAASHFSDRLSPAVPFLDDTAYMPRLCEDHPQAQFSHDPAFFQHYDCSTQLPFPPQQDEQQLAGPLLPDNYLQGGLLPAVCPYGQPTEVVPSNQPFGPPPSRPAGMFTTLLQDVSPGELLYNDDMLLLRMVGDEEVGGQTEPLMRWTEPNIPIGCGSESAAKLHTNHHLDPVLYPLLAMHSTPATQDDMAPHDAGSGGLLQSCDVRSRRLMPQSGGPTRTARPSEDDVEPWLQQMDPLPAALEGLRWDVAAPIHWSTPKLE